jgi:hypothetical protein
MLVNELPAYLITQDKTPLGYFKVDAHISAMADSFVHCSYKLAWLRKMFKYTATKMIRFTGSFEYFAV